MGWIRHTDSSTRLAVGVTRSTPSRHGATWGWSTLLILLLTTSAHAQRVPPDTTGLPLAQARSLADAHAPDRLLALSRSAIAAREVDVAGMLTNPTVTVGSNVNTARFYTAISVPLPLFGQRGAAIDAARAFEAAALQDVEVARLDVRFGTTLAWIDLWLAEHETTAANETAERDAQLLAAAEARLAEGAVPRLDVVRARAESLRTRADADAARSSVASASARLVVWLGDPSMSTGVLRTDGDPTETPAAALPALLAALDHHPMQVAAQARTHASQANVSLEERRRLPLVGVEAGSTFFDPSLAAPGQPAPAFSDAHLALSVEVPVFHVHGALIARARAAEELSSVEARAVRVRLESELLAAYAQFRASDARAAAQWHDVLPATQEAADLALESYREGRTDIQGVLAAQQALGEARITAWRLAAERARAWAALEHATGSTP